MSYGVDRDLTSFGIERDHEYTGHLTLATHLVPLPRRTFASADETHIRIWGPSGDLAKTMFPSNRRSMVSAMAYCSTFSALLTAEVDMTLKVYFTHTLDLLDVFPLGQARKKGENNEGREKGEKVSAMVYLPQHCWVMVGGESGCDLWHLSKSNKRRPGGAVGRLEQHLQLIFMRSVTRVPVLNIVADMSEQRMIMWGPKSLSIYDMELNLITKCKQPHSEPVRCACIQIISILDTALLTGGEDGNVNFWSIQGKQYEAGVDDVPTDKPRVSSVSTRLEHSFRGHSRTVEVVNFYHRKQTGAAQSLCVSYARDGKMKVWSLIQFSIVYTLDVSFLDSKVFIFPLAQHFFAFSASAPGGAGAGQRQRTTLTLTRFTAHLACPFATTYQSPVVIINRPLSPSVVDLAKRPPVLSDAVALVSEDVAVRIVDTQAKRLISCLPPPPNSQVQVLRVFIVPIWQILVLWLSSQELAIFFVPTGDPSQSKDGTKDSDMEPSLEAMRAVKSTTPLLIRRFSIFEVRAHSFDKQLPKEAFRSVALHCGKAPPNIDTCTQSGFEAPESAASSSAPDWFLIVGTHIGTLQAYRLREILAASPIWARIAKHLPSGSWEAPRTSDAFQQNLARKAASEIERARLEAFEAEVLDAMEASRVWGQRPFPRDAPPLRFHGRWRCHEYFIEVTEAVRDSLLTLDMKRNLKVWDAQTMRCLVQYRIGEFACHTLYVTCRGDSARSAQSVGNLSREGADSWEEEHLKQSFSGLAASPEDVLSFAGLALGSSSGSLQLILVDTTKDREPEIVQSTASHTKGILQVDYVWPINVFVTIGADDILKIWSHRLIPLREIIFPQPLTSVSFRQRHDLDVSSGHGDILLGFASHVETISFDFWSRGTPDEMIGRNAIRQKSAGSRNLYYTSRGVQRADASDNIDHHEVWLHAPDPMSARRSISTKKGVGFRGAAFVIRFVNAMTSTRRRTVAPDEMENFAVAMGRLQQGDVMDFRGEPLTDVASLSGQMVDNSILDSLKRPIQDESTRHKRATHHNKGDFADYTHDHPGYYDRFVQPSYIVDAPRHQAIRGGVDANNDAIITSMGSMQAKVDPDEPVKSSRPLDYQAFGVGELEFVPLTSEKESPKSSQKLTSNAARAQTRARPPIRPLNLQPAAMPRSSNNVSGCNMATEQCASSVPGVALQQDKIEPGDEPWRSKRIARGTPKDEPVKPRTQDVANSDSDTARLLTERGNISEVPDLPEENQLKRLLAKKVEWLYSPRDSQVLFQKRSTIQQMQTDHGVKQIWTPAGRLVCGEGSPPSSNVPFPCRPPPHLAKARMPMTRAEVTEQRLIELASQPPGPPPQFAIEARLPPSRYAPMSSRSQPSSPRETQNAFPTDDTGQTMSGRVLVQSTRASVLQSALTAR